MLPVASAANYILCSAPERFAVGRGCSWVEKWQLVGLISRRRGFDSHPSNKLSMMSVRSALCRAEVTLHGSTPCFDSTFPNSSRVERRTVNPLMVVRVHLWEQIVGIVHVVEHRLVVPASTVRVCGLTQIINI